jgi:acyl-CoA synthetase (AMP-forming)/AMP-acid ligase II
MRLNHASAMNAPLFRLWSATVERSPSAVAVIDAATGRLDPGGAGRGGPAMGGAYRREAGKSTPVRRRVAMSVPNGAEWFRVFLGLLSAGAVPAPIDPSEPEEAQLAAARAIGAAFIWRGGRLERVAPRASGVFPPMNASSR